MPIAVCTKPVSKPAKSKCDPPSVVVLRLKADYAFQQFGRLRVTRWHRWFSLEEHDDKPRHEGYEEAEGHQQEEAAEVLQQTRPPVGHHKVLGSGRALEKGLDGLPVQARVRV